MGNHLAQSDSEKPLLWAGKQCQQMRVWTAWWNHAEAGWNHCLTPREIQSVVSANEQPGQWFTHWRRDVGLCQSQSLGDAGTQQPQAGAGGLERHRQQRREAFLFCLPTEKQVLFDLQRKDRWRFFSSGTDCFKTIGNKWCSEIQLFPYISAHCRYHKSSYLRFQFAVTSLGHSFAI